MIKLSDRCPPEFQILECLLKIDSPSSDEGPLSDWIKAWVLENVEDADVHCLNDSVIVVRGTPTTAIFAHIDTTGFTLDSKGRLIGIGSPSPQNEERLKQVGCAYAGDELIIGEDDEWSLKGSNPGGVGSRWVYADEPFVSGDELQSPYLDNRAGVWAALQALVRCSNIAVAFTACEELSGRGAAQCARWIFDRLNVTQALIADITWHTASVTCGQGVTISLRDRYIPRQRYLQRILKIAEESAIPYQLEVESEGASDGATIERSGLLMDWVFVGAPEHRPHTSTEMLNLGDLRGMADLLTALVAGLG